MFTWICSSHVPIRSAENWKKELDNKKYFGAILMYLSKAFNCLANELLIAKMNAYTPCLSTPPEYTGEWISGP